MAFGGFPPVLLVLRLILFILNSEKCESASLPLIKILALFRATMVTGSKESRRLMAKSLVKNEYSQVSIIVALPFKKIIFRIISLPSVFILLTHFIDIPRKAMHEVAIEKKITQ